MKKTVLAIMLMSTAVQASACCWEEFDLEEQTPTDTRQLSSMGIGATMGGLLAGPVGLFFGGALGGVYESFNETQNRYAQMQKDYGALQQKKRQYEKQLAAYKLHQPEITHVVKTSYTPLLSNELLQLFNNMELTALFRFADDRLEPVYRQQLAGVLHSFAKIPGCHAYIEGHADRTGTDRKNLDLSARRIATVKALMLQQGWHADRIHTKAVGEAQPLTQENDKPGYMFDRRVLVRLSFGGTQL